MAQWLRVRTSDLVVRGSNLTEDFFLFKQEMQKSILSTMHWRKLLEEIQAYFARLDSGDFEWRFRETRILFCRRFKRVFVVFLYFFSREVIGLFCRGDRICILSVVAGGFFSGTGIQNQYEPSFKLTACSGWCAIGPPPLPVRLTKPNILRQT